MRLKILVWREVVTVITMAALVIPGAIYWGLWGVLAARVITDIARFIFALWAIRRYAGFHVRLFLKQSWRSVVAVIIMSGLVYLTQTSLVEGDGAAVLAGRAIAQMGVGMVSYSAILFGLWHLCGRPEGPEVFLLEKFSGV